MFSSRVIRRLYILLLHHILVMRWNSLVCAARRTVFSPVSEHARSSVTAVSHSSESLDILSSLISRRRWLPLAPAQADALWNFSVDLASPRVPVRMCEASHIAFFITRIFAHIYTITLLVILDSEGVMLMLCCYNDNVTQG